MSANTRPESGFSSLVGRARQRLIESVRWRTGYYESLQMPPFPGRLDARAFSLSPFAEKYAPHYRVLQDDATTAAAELPPLTGSAAEWAQASRTRIEQRVSPYELAITTEDRMIGVLTLVRIAAPTPTVEFGITLSPEFQGTSAAFRATRAIIDWLWSAGIHRVVTTHILSNETAHRTATSFGFRVEGTWAAYYPHGEQWRDACAHAIVNPAQTASAVS